MRERRDDVRVANIRARGPDWEHDYAHLCDDNDYVARGYDSPEAIEKVLQRVERKIKVMTEKFGAALLAKPAMDD